jgi:putative hydrolase of the HAD superfamily
MFDWSKIETVLLDMDGTLLDLHFDNHFWMEHVPARYAEATGVDRAAAKTALMARYKDIEGTLEWYCVDHWSRELGLDIALLKQEVQHLIQVHPHVSEFLEALQAGGMRRVLVTNAHQKALALKLQKTELAGHFDRVVCAHELGLPKEDPGFWPRLHAIMPFDPASTLFVDDNVSVLRSARTFGMGHLLAIVAPDSRQPAREVRDFLAVANFAAVLPELRGFVSNRPSA